MHQSIGGRFNGSGINVFLPAHRPPRRLRIANEPHTDHQVVGNLKMLPYAVRGFEMLAYFRSSSIQRILSLISLPDTFFVAEGDEVKGHG